MRWRGSCADVCLVQDRRNRVALTSCSHGDMASLPNKVAMVPSVVFGFRNAKLGEEVVRAIEQAGGRAVFQVTEVRKPENAKALME